MEAIPKARKHNHLSSPLPSTVTRSRSQSLLHRNRSGQIRRDPAYQKPHLGIVRSDGNGSNQESSDLEDEVLLKNLRKKAKCDDDEDLSRRLAKDLRARRVYSPQSSAGVSDQKIDDLGFVSRSSAANSGDCVEDVMLSATMEPTWSSDLGLSCEARNFDLGNTESSDEREKLQDNMQIDGKSREDCSKEIVDLGEEPVLTTPPDAVICGSNLKINGVVGTTEEELRVNDASFAGNAVEISGKDGQLNGSVLRSKSVLGPRLPGKLFKAPGSVSYRKLFPFLMDIMGDDSGTPKLGHCLKDEKGMDRPEFQFSLSSQSNEVSQHELKTNRFTNGSNLTSSPMQLDAKEVTSECLPMPFVDEKCMSESKADPTAEDAGNALHNDDFKQNSVQEENLDHAKATNHSGFTSEQIGILNQDCVLTTHDYSVEVVNIDQLQSTPQDMRHVKTNDDNIYDNSVVNVDQLQSMPQGACHIKFMDFTRSTQENIFEGCCSKADKTNGLPLKRKYVPRPHLHGRLFKTPGSVSYKRMLPFLMDLNKDDSGTLKFCDQIPHKKDEADMYAKGSQLPLASQSEEASINGQMTVSGPMHDAIESKASENNSLVTPGDESSHGYQPKLTSPEDTTELPMQLDAKEVVQELFASSVKEHFEKVVIGSKDECLSESKFDPCSRMGDFHCAKIVVNAAHNDACNQVESEISGQDCSGSPPVGQNMLYINGDISGLTFKHPSSKEKELTSDSEGRKHFLNVEKHDSVSSCPPEGQCLTQLSSNILDMKNETSSLATSKSDDAVVLNHVSVPNEEPRPQPSEKIISEKTDMTAHGGDKAGSVLKGLVSSCPSEGQCLTQLGSNMLDAKNEIGSLATSKSDDAVVLNHVSVPNEEPRPQPSEKIISEKTDMTAHGGDKAGCVLKGLVSSCPPEGQCPTQLGSNMLDAKNEIGSLATSKSDDVVVLNHVSVPNEEPRLQPSEKIISVKTDMTAHGGDKAGSVLKGLVYGSRTPSKGSNNKNASCASEVQNGPKSNIPLVLNRCPRIKALNHAGSFNYKRLLPFMKDCSCASINDHYPKRQKLLDQTPRLPISVSNLLVTPTYDSNVCVPTNHCTGNSGNRQETGLQACDLNIDSSRSQIPSINEAFKTREGVASSVSGSPVYSEVIGNSSFPISSYEGKPPGTHGSCQSLSQLKVTEKLRVHAVGFKKGILRSNPRGCRGLCMCLSCVSFRLNAERAFEFSRNQLLDAEEVSQDLMKELSHLRNLLERSTDSVNNGSVFDGSQVKEACKKAFETEQLAKDRLSQMKDDLNIHCRIPNLQRPRVKFSDHVEEKIIQSDR